MVFYVPKPKTAKDVRHPESFWCRQEKSFLVFYKALSQYDTPEEELRFSFEPIGDCSHVILKGSWDDVMPLLTDFHQT